MVNTTQLMMFSSHQEPTACMSDSPLISVLEGKDSHWMSKPLLVVSMDFTGRYIYVLNSNF